METIPSKHKDEFVKAIKDFWTIAVGILGAVITIVNFIHLWSGDQEMVTYVIFGFGFAFIIFSLSWFGFRRKKNGIYDARGKLKQVFSAYYPKTYKWARIILLFCGLGGVGTGYLLYHQQIVLDSKIVVLVTEINGPNPENYRVTEELIVQLKKELADYSDTKVIAIPEAITVQQGSDYARNLGKKHHADIILWGWYGVTNSDTRLYLNVENLNDKLFPDMSSSNTIESQSEVINLNSFSLQQNTGSQIGATILFLRGLAVCRRGEWQRIQKW